MNLRHDIIKMRYVEEGYLPNYPFHLISDAEMCDAFIKEDGTGFFFDHYPNNFNGKYDSQYNELVSALRYHMDQLKNSSKTPSVSEYGVTYGYETDYTLPDWVYSYMLGAVIGPESEIADIHDMLVLMNRDNIDDIFTEEAAQCCLDISRKWIRKLQAPYSSHRPPTIFGETHVIKALRLQDVKSG